MKPLFSIIIIFTFVGCIQNKADLNLVTKELKYSASYWHFNQQADSYEFYLVHYISIDQKGNFELMRHDEWLGTPHYFKGIIQDTTLRKLINAAFSKDNFKYDYTWKIEDGIYDGYTYCFDYTKVKSNDNKIIQFIPNKSPAQIELLSLNLENLIYYSKGNKLDTLDLKNYTEKLEQLSILEHGGRLPKPTKPALIENKILKSKN